MVIASQDHGAYCENQCKAFSASYPSISTYVTAVGSTQFCNGGQSGPECATSQFGSGGGFATNVFPAPTYQAAVIKKYMSIVTNTPPPSTFNASNRGNPDFAALGSEFYQVIDHGQTVSVGGTSCATPVISAIITLLNDELLNANKNTMGFVNPQWYQWAQQQTTAFFDVTSGNNQEGCTPQQCSPYLNGYLCAPGWDAVTGMGTPNFKVLSQLNAAFIESTKSQ